MMLLLGVGITVVEPLCERGPGQFWGERDGVRAERLLDQILHGGQLDIGGGDG